MVPTKDGETYRVKTGFEKVMPHRTEPPFAFSAKEKGKVTEIDEQAQMVEVTYDSGRTETFHYGDEVSRNPGQGFNLRQHMELNGIKEGGTFKKGDVLAYNDAFFEPDPYSKQVEMTMGITGNVALMDDNDTLEDSSAISSKTADRLEFYPIYDKVVTVPVDTNLHHIVKTGEEVSNIDPLMVFDEADVPESLSQNADPELVDMLGELNRTTPQADHDGVVKRVECFRSNSLEDMSESVAQAVQHVEEEHNKKARFSQNADNKHEFPDYGQLSRSTRVEGQDLDNDVVVFKFFIENTSGMSGGSKIIFASSLKSVVCDVYEDPIDTEDGSMAVDAKTSFRGIQNRIVTGVMLTGVSARVLDDLEQQVLDIIDE